MKESQQSRPFTMSDSMTGIFIVRKLSQFWWKESPTGACQSSYDRALSKPSQGTTRKHMCKVVDVQCLFADPYPCQSDYGVFRSKSVFDFRVLIGYGVYWPWYNHSMTHLMSYVHGPCNAFKNKVSGCRYLSASTQVQS